MLRLEELRVELNRVCEESVKLSGEGSELVLRLSEELDIEVVKEQRRLYTLYSGKVLS